jgi:RNA polymerase sigma-70 factor (ECF subfamily)
VLASGELYAQPGAGAKELSSGPADEAALLRAGRAGDLAALDALLVLHERPLLAFCSGVLGHTEDAEDAVQETFLRALRALSTFRGESAFRTWLFRIAMNVCLGRKPTRPPAVPLTDHPSSQPMSTPSPEAVALRQLRIQEALASLLPRQRAILLLKEREGWSIGEIAAAFRWTERQVRYELSKARRALAQWRRQTDEGDEP